MGFFKDFKRDFAQAVNELMPDKDELSGEYDDEDMVNTFDENDNMEIAPEDMLENLDDFSSDDNIGTFGENSAAVTAGESAEEDEEEADAQRVIPEAEILNDYGDMEVNTFDETVPEELVAETEVEDTVLATPEESSLLDEVHEVEGDELKSLEELDEPDMEENLEDALKVEAEKTEDDDLDELAGIVGKKVNISKDVSDAMLMREDIPEEDDSEVTGENEDWEESMSEIEKINEEEMKDSNVESILADDTTYITKGTVVTGNISTEGGIDIIGTVNGDVECAGKLILGGKIVGSVMAGELYANAAKIEGEVIVESSAKVGVGSVIVGNVTATSAVIAGAVNGDIDVKGPVIVDSTAVIMGNIKSRSVQINNGAVIEGFCSQCYSEIDVKSFFE